MAARPRGVPHAIAITLEGDGRDLFVRHAHGTLVATAHGPEWAIDSIRVDPYYRQRGIGRALLAAFLAEVDSEGDERPVYLYVGAGEEAVNGSLSLEALGDWYERHGFVWLLHTPTTRLMARPGRNGTTITNDGGTDAE